MDLSTLGDEGREPRGRGGKMPREIENRQGLRRGKGVHPFQEARAKWVKNARGEREDWEELDGLRMTCFGVAILSLAPFSSVLLRKAGFGFPWH